MIKQLGIAAACGIALYGLARYLNNNFVVVIDSTGNFPDLLAPDPASLEDGAATGETGIRTPQDEEGLPTNVDTAEAEPAGADEAQAPGQVGDAQVTPCP